MTDTAGSTTTTTDAGAGAPGTTTTDTTNGLLTQEQVDRIVKDRVARERAKLGDVAELQRKASEFDRLAEAQKSELEKATEKAVRETEERVRTETEGAWKKRILRSEVKVAAAGKLNDPADALAHLDLSAFEVDDDGNADEAAIASAIDKLLEDKPYLGAGATARQRPTREFDAGTRTNGSTLPLNGDPLTRDLELKLGVR